jgi:hypothetical protein
MGLPNLCRGYIPALPISVIRGEAAVVIDSSAVIHRLDLTALADASKFYRYLVAEQVQR